MHDTSQYDQHPIYKAMKKIDPAYEPEQIQGFRMLGSKDPEKDAGLIRKRIGQIKAAVSRVLGVDPADITDAQAMSAMVEFHGYGETIGAEDKIAARMGIVNAFEIGRIIERKNAVPQKGLVEMCYEDILQRPSDSEGFQHYQDRLDAGGDGNSTLDLVRDIYLSPEAVALREQGST